MANIAPTAHQQFQLIVEPSTVAAAFGNNWFELVNMPFPQGMIEIGLACHHPIFVALHRVDLAVVADDAERLCQFPRGQGIRAIALVKDSDGGGKVRVAEVWIKMSQFRRQYQPLINNRATAQAGNVKTLHTRRARSVHNRLAHQIEHTLIVITRLTRFGRAAQQTCSIHGRLASARRPKAPSTTGTER